MASIKISALGELVLDRLSDTDNLIINDENTTTQRITYKTIREGLDRDARYFTGPVEFGNTVIFNGPLGGRNVYTKDETLFEINAALKPVQDDLDLVEAQVDNLQLLSGVASGTVIYLTSEFTTDNMRLGAANYNTKTALHQLDKGAFDANNAIQANFDKSAQQDLRLAALDSTADPKGLAVVNAEAIAALEAAVFAGDNSNAIGDNTTNIEANTSYIDNIAKQIGTHGAGKTAVNLGILSLVNVNDNVNVTQAITQLDGAVETVRGLTVVNATAISEAQIAAADDHQELKDLYTALAQVAGGTYNTAQELTAALANALSTVVIS